MSNTNNNMQTQTSSDLHNAIIEAGDIDRPPMLAPGIDNDIYSIVYACLNAMQTWKAIERSQATIRNRGKAIANSPPPTYDPELKVVADDEASSKEKGIEKLMALMSMECKKPKQAQDLAYHKEKMLLCKQEEAGIQLSAEQVDWKDDTDDELEDQELEAHYIYMHPEQPESVNDTYFIEQGDINITRDSLDKSNNRDEADPDDDL
ncbi:hypothetical protein Tco_1092951 [Tanacetum coccineum]|uniref:Uncharacterized protein n=1 Tax=Tanacetum coccineum TaxID=301880 RepID=A0ABQ5IDG0_9ASTR